MHPIAVRGFAVMLAGLALPFSYTAALAVDSRTDQIARETSSPLATRSENPVFEYSARKALGNISEARVALSYGQREAAVAHVDEALRELHAIRNTRDYLEMTGVRFGRVLYDTSASYYIPIADDTYAVRTYTRGPFWSPEKTTAVRDVELINVDIAINPEKSESYLESARAKINRGEYNEADIDLKRFLDEALHEKSAGEQPLTRLQDNIYLTRILIRQENYDGARYTLRHAKSALDTYESAAAPAEAKTIAALREDINRLEATIQKRDPTMMEKAADTVDKWWENIKSWSRPKPAGEAAVEK